MVDKTSVSSSAALAALLESTLHRSAARVDRKATSSRSRTTSLAAEGGRAALAIEDRRRRHKRGERRSLPVTSSALERVAAVGQPLSLARRPAGHGKRVANPSLHSATTDAGSEHHLKVRSRASAKMPEKLPSRWFESANEPCDRNGSRVGQTKNVTEGRGYAGYVVHRPLRPRSAEPTLSRNTEYSTAFVDLSDQRDVLKACETVYTKEKLRNELFILMGGDPRRDATVAHLAAKYGPTEYQKAFRWRSSDDMAIAKGTSPDLEAKRKDVEEAYRRIVENKCRDLNIMEAARAAVKMERRSQSARVTPRRELSRSPSPPRRPLSALAESPAPHSRHRLARAAALPQLDERSSTGEITQIVRAQMQTQAAVQLAEDMKRAKLKMARRRTVSGQPREESPLIVRPRSVQYAQRPVPRTLSLADFCRAAIDAEGNASSSRAAPVQEAAVLRDGELDQIVSADEADQEICEAPIAESMRELMQAPDLTSIAKWCSNLPRENSLSRCSTAPSLRNGGSAASVASSARSWQSGLRHSVPVRPKSAGAMRASSDSRIVVALAELAGLPEAIANTERKQNSIARVDSSVALNGSPKRRRPSSAVARLRAATSEVAPTPKLSKSATPMLSDVNQVACGAAHQAIRGTRPRPSTAGPGGRKSKTYI